MYWIEKQNWFKQERCLWLQCLTFSLVDYVYLQLAMWNPLSSQLQEVMAQRYLASLKKKYILVCIYYMYIDKKVLIQCSVCHCPLLTTKRGLNSISIKWVYFYIWIYPRNAHLKECWYMYNIRHVNFSI